MELESRVQTPKGPGRVTGTHTEETSPPTRSLIVTGDDDSFYERFPEEQCKPIEG